MKIRKLLPVLFLISIAGLPFIHAREKAKQKEALRESPKNDYIEFDLHYKFSVSERASKVRFVALLPRTMTGRQKIFIKYFTKPTKVYREKGNRYAEFVFLRPKREFKVIVSIRADFFRYDLDTALRRTEKKLTKGTGFRDSLRHEKGIEKNHPLIQKIAKSITGESEIELVKNIYYYVIDNTTYAKDNRSYGALYAARNKTGDCDEYADLFVALCRAKKIPARTIFGYTPQVSLDEGHAWAEVYFRKLGWVPFDPTFGDIKSSKYRERSFYEMKSTHVYFSNIRNNDRLIEGHRYYAQSWGGKIEIEDSIILKNSSRIGLKDN